MYKNGPTRESCHNHYQPEQTAALVALLKNPPAGEEDVILDLITNRIPAGVDQAAYVKAGFLAAITKGEAESPLIDKSEGGRTPGNNARRLQHCAVN